MKLLRNPQVKKELLTQVVLGLLFTVPAVNLSPLCAGLVLSACVCFALSYLYFTRRRYAELARLSERIDRILHAQESVLITSSEEGELAILNSEIHKMTVRLKEQSDLLRSDKTRLTDAIADIFHQMRTPLTSMNLMVSLLSEDELSFERRIQLTRELRQQLERTQWLVESLLKMSKIDAGTALFRCEQVSVAQLIQKAAEPLLIPMELRSMELSVTVAQEQFNGDLAWTTEALGNVLKNCVEHTPEGGRIALAAQETALFTEITVQDSGSGFDPTDLPYLFDRFYKGKNAAAGSIGIGLALSRMIIAAQNGTVTAGNAPEGGARFVIRFYKSVV